MVQVMFALFSERPIATVGINCFHRSTISALQNYIHRDAFALGYRISCSLFWYFPPFQQQCFYSETLSHYRKFSPQKNKNSSVVCYLGGKSLHDLKQCGQAVSTGTRCTTEIYTQTQAIRLRSKGCRPSLHQHFISLVSSTFLRSESITSFRIDNAKSFEKDLRKINLVLRIYKNWHRSLGSIVYFIQNIRENI